MYIWILAPYSKYMKKKSYLASKGINDKLEALRGDSLDTLLDDMVAILVFDALEHISLQFGNYELLLIQRDTFQRFLNHPTAIHLQGQGLDIGSELKKSQRKIIN